MKIWFFFCLLATAFILVGCVFLNRTEKAHIESAVRQVLDAQLTAWNNGNIEDFMETYWHSEKLRFASGGTVRVGWEATRERYLNKYPDRDAMGTVRFKIHAVEVLSPDSAVAFGEWQLQRESGDLSGLFTLILRRIDDRWVIVHDHTSSAQ